MTKEQALYLWFSQFGTVYVDTVMPVIDSDEIDYPYGTYELAVSSFLRPVAITFSWWERTTSLESSVLKIREVEQALGRDGVIIPCDGGGIRIAPADPFVRTMSDDSDRMIRRTIFNLQIEYITEV